MSRPKIEVLSNAKRSMVAKYKKGAGLVALNAEFDVSIPVIRRVLIEAGETIRGRGRPALATA